MSCRKIKSEIKELSTELLDLKDKRTKLIKKMTLEEKKFKRKNKYKITR